MNLLSLIDPAVLGGTIRMATPLLLVCLAGLFSERAGVFDIGLEGKMLFAAFVAAAVAALSGSVWLGLLAAIGGSLLLSLVHGLASITFRGNQLMSGVAINIFAVGFTVVVAQSTFGEGARTPKLVGIAERLKDQTADDRWWACILNQAERFELCALPGALTRLRDIAQASLPVKIYSQVLSGHALIVYVALLLVPLSWWVLYRTRFGLRLRAVGENPAAVDTAGISVVGLRYTALVICGVLCGIAGAYLSTALQAGFVRDMTAGRGFIALAALIFAKWRPWYALWACLLFGYLQALALRPDLLQKAVGLSVKVQLLDALPYILTVVILAGFVGRAIPPRAGGEPYVKER
jgi:ABC-type uncharacterized transport system permease subunit